MGRRPNPRLQSPRFRCESWKCNRKKWTYFSGTKSAAHTTGEGRSHHSEVFVEQKTYSFLYQDGDTVVLMEPDTFEQVEVSRELFGNAAVYLKENIPVTLHMYDERIMSASIPPKVTCTVVDAPPTHKGLTAVPQYKKVLLDNGLTVSVPPFIKSSDQIIVNTIEDTYVTRAK